MRDVWLALIVAIEGDSVRLRLRQSPHYAGMVAFFPATPERLAELGIDSWEEAVGKEGTAYSYNNVTYRISWGEGYCGGDPVYGEWRREEQYWPPGELEYQNQRRAQVMS